MTQSKKIKGIRNMQRNMRCQYTSDKHMAFKCNKGRGDNKMEKMTSMEVRRRLDGSNCLKNAEMEMVMISKEECPEAIASF